MYSCLFFTNSTKSKLGNILFTKELVRRYGNQGLISIAVHPGAFDFLFSDTACLSSFVFVLLGPVNTDLTRSHSWLSRKLGALLTNDTTYGATTQLFAATIADASKINGKVRCSLFFAEQSTNSHLLKQYLVPLAVEAEPTAAAYNVALAQKMWEWCEAELTSF